MSKIPSMIKYGVFGFLLLISSCTPASQDADFKLFIKSFYQSKTKQFPLWATKDGHIKLKKTLIIPDQKKHAVDLQFCKNYYDSLQYFDPERLSVPLQFEYNKIKPFLTNLIHDIEIKRIYESDPTYYELYRDFELVMKYGKIPIDQQLEIIEGKLKKIPEYYEAAIENLKSPNQQKLKEAIDQQIRFYTYLNKEIPKKIQRAGLTKSQFLNFEHLIFQAKLSIKDFIAFCKSKEFDYFDKVLKTKQPTSTGSQLVKITNNKN